MDLVTVASINFSYLLIKALAGLGLLYAMDKWIWKELDIVKELKKGNLAVALCVGFYWIGLFWGSALLR